MRILHVILNFDEQGGGPMFGLGVLARQQAAQGHDVAILPARRTGNRQVIEHGQHGNLIVYPAPTDSTLMFADEHFDRAIDSLVADRDIVHIHGVWRHSTRATEDASLRHGVPYILDPDGCFGAVSIRQKWWFKLPYFYAWEKSGANKASGIHCHSTKEMRELERFRFQSRRFVVPHAVDARLLEIPGDDAVLAESCPNLRPGQKVVLTLGRLCWVKRMDLLVDAFAQLHAAHPDWHLVLAGPHEDSRIVMELQKKVQDAGISEVVSMPGMVRAGQKVALLRRASVYAHPSAHESFGIAVAEAMLFGLPVVLSDGVALCEDVRQTGSGLVAPCESGAFTEALRQVMADDRFRADCGRNAANTSLRFLPDKVAGNMHQEYEACISSN